MNSGSRQHFEQCYNAQAAAGTVCMLIIWDYVTVYCNDRKVLAPIVESVDHKIAQVNTASADTGFYSGEAVKAAGEPEEKGN